VRSSRPRVRESRRSCDGSSCRALPLAAARPWLHVYPAVSDETNPPEWRGCGYQRYDTRACVCLRREGPDIRSSIDMLIESMLHSIVSAAGSASRRCACTRRLPGTALRDSAGDRYVPWSSIFERKRARPSVEDARLTSWSGNPLVGAPGVLAHHVQYWWTPPPEGDQTAHHIVVVDDDVIPWEIDATWRSVRRSPYVAGSRSAHHGGWRSIARRWPVRGPHSSRRTSVLIQTK
jgi:hypothetical protein